MFKKTIILIYFISLLNFGTTLNNNDQKTSPNIIIIGTGPSGIAAGTKLYENGIKNIQWLEAENRIGGRIYTEKFGEHLIDLGAQWCHGEKDNVVYEMAYPLGLLEHSPYNYSNPEEYPFQFFNPNGVKLPEIDSFKLFNAINEIIENDVELAQFNGSYGEYIQLKFQEKMNTEFSDINSNISNYILNWFYKAENSMEASDSLYDVSAKIAPTFSESDGDQGLIWKGRGYHTILDILMKKLPDPLKALPIDDKIQLNKEVVNIDWNSEENKNGVTIRCKDGTEYKADHVIVTVSLGVLKDRINTLFKPELPLSKLRAVEGLNMGTVGKLIFKFPKQWWPNYRGFSFVWNENEIEEKLKEFDGPVESNKWLLDIFGAFPILDQPDFLLAWIVSSSSREVETMPMDVVQSKVMQLFRMFLGDTYKIPEPIQFIRSKWYTNPHFRGTYSFRSMTTEKMNVSSLDLAEPIQNSAGKQVLLFAGEATHDRHYSTVHGAIESGWREADRLLKLYSTKKGFL